MAQQPQGGSFITFAVTLAADDRTRLRRKHTKVFTGCVACKKRHVKCTEEKPSCSRCLQTNTPCSYTIRRAWLFDSPKTETQDQVALRLPLQSSLPQNPSVGYSDRRDVFYYREVVAPVFSFYFGKTFWSSSALQVSDENPVVRNALIGAANMVESVEKGDPSQRLSLQMSFFANYNKALSGIAKADASLPSRITLTACIVFACLEMIKGSMDNSISHVKAGLKIAQARMRHLIREGKGDGEEARFLKNEVLPMMTGFAIQAYVYGTGLMSAQDISDLASDRYELPHIPNTFEDIRVAHLGLSGIIHHIAVADIGCNWERDYVENLGRLLQHWICAYDRCVRKLTVQQKAEARVEDAVLRCNFDLAKIVLKALMWRARQAGINKGFVDTIRQYQDMQDVLCGSVRDESAAKSISPLFIVPITSTASHPVSSHAKSEEMDWSSQHAMSLAHAIISMRDSTGSVTDEAVHQAFDEGQSNSAFSSPKSDHGVGAVSLSHPQQLSKVSLLVLPLPKSVAELQHSSAWKVVKAEPAG